MRTDLRLHIKVSGTVCVWSMLWIMFLIWSPAYAYAASAHEKMPIHVGQTVLDTQTPASPDVDPTVTALQKQQLETQNAWSSWTNLATPLSILAGLLTLLGGAWRYLRDQRAEREKQHEVERQQLADRQAEREKQAEERFQKVVEGLGNTNEASQVGAAIMLRTFLRQGKGYEQFYSQAFDLAVAHLRLRTVDPKDPEQLTSLSQALVTIFKEAYPLARDWLKQHPRYLDAARIQLDHAYLSSTDLQKIWIPKAHLRKATLRSTNLSHANLNGVDLTGANLCGTMLNGANLYGAILRDADLNGADLTNVDLNSVKDWTHARLHHVKGLTEAQLKECEAKGAIITESNAANDNSEKTAIQTRTKQNPQHSV